MRRIESDRLALLEVILDALGLAEQERDMLVRGVDEAGDDLHRLLELLDELVVLAVAPGGAQAAELAVQGRHRVGQVAVEPLEVLGEPPQFVRIDDGLCHGTPRRVVTPPARPRAEPPDLVRSARRLGVRAGSLPRLTGPRGRVKVRKAASPALRRGGSLELL